MTVSTWNASHDRLFSAELERAKAEGKKCHTKTMMSRKADKTIITVCCLFFILKKDEIRGKKM
jgi:hypothetical protein